MCGSCGKVFETWEGRLECELGHMLDDYSSPSDDAARCARVVQLVAALAAKRPNAI